MRLRMRLLAAAALTVAMVILGIWLGWFADRTPVAALQSQPDQDQDQAMERTSSDRFFRKNRQGRSPTVVTNESPAEVVVTETDMPVTGWEDRIDEVLKLEADPAELGKTMLALLPQLPAAGRLEALQHIANLLADADYAPVGELVTNPQTAPAELDLLVPDLLNRPNPLKLPLLLKIARTPDHPKVGEATEILEVLFGPARPEDRTGWEERVAELLNEEGGLAALDQP